MTARLPILLVLTACASPASSTSTPIPSTSARSGELPSAMGEDGPPTTTFAWPVRTGWRSETIPFPLGFAPTIDFHGVEEIRFAPGFFDPKAPGYFTYTFVWWLEDAAPTEETLEQAFTTYFAGLCAAVAKDEKLCGSVSHVAKLAVDKPPGDWLTEHQGWRYRGTIDTLDPFTAKKPITLALALAIWQCPSSGRTTILVTATPAAGTPLADELRAQADAFECHVAPQQR